MKTNIKKLYELRAKSSKVKTREGCNKIVAECDILLENHEIDAADYNDILLKAILAYTNASAAGDFLPYRLCTADNMFDSDREDVLVLSKKELQLVLRKAIINLANMDGYEFKYTVRMAKIIFFELPSPYGIDEASDLGWTTDFIKWVVKGLDHDNVFSIMRSLCRKYEDQQKQYGCSDYDFRDLIKVEAALSRIWPKEYIPYSFAKD